MARAFLGGRVVAARWVAYLALGDVVSLLLFATAGSYSHGGSLLSVFETALQFGAGWLVVAILAGAYGPRARSSVGRAALLGAGVWAVGSVVGALVRVAIEPGAGLSPVFLAVTVAVGAAIFGGWRAVAAKSL